MASPDHALECFKPAPTSWLMLTVIGGLAEFERDWIRARTSEGRERAKAPSVKLGLKPKLTEHQERLSVGEAPRGTARSYNTISRLRARRANLSDDEATIR